MWAGLLCPSRAFGHHCKTHDRPATSSVRFFIAAVDLRAAAAFQLQPKLINHRTQFILF